MRTAIVTLGGVEYTIEEAKSRRNSAWRASLQAEFGPLFDVLLGSQTIQLESTDDLLKVVSTLAPSILASVDKISTLVFGYSPALALDRERIAEEAYDGEVVDAFLAVLGLAYPFGGLLSRLGTLTGGTGPVAPPTGPSGA
jgi:hypothetical protein